MRRLLLPLLLTACAHKAPAPAPTAAVEQVAPDAAIAAAVADPSRPEDDVARDADRKPAEVLAFFGIRPGMTVADLMTGRGYYAEILAHLVGPQGLVYAQNNRFVVDKYADQPLRERLSRPGMERVVRIDTELDTMELPPASLDAALMVLFYHDTVWMDVDREAMNARIYAAIKPGGVFGVIDHRAAAGHGVDDVKTLHRIEQDPVVREILEAGFVLEATSDLLAHPEDDHTANVFDDSIRGRTDRFVLRFRKPTAPMP